jgi:hypothetical protein
LVVVLGGVFGGCGPTMGDTPPAGGSPAIARGDPPVGP